MQKKMSIRSNRFPLAFGASAQDQDSIVKTDAETAAELGLLLGDGSGVNAAYLGKQSTRLQAAIISLRLQGLLEEAETLSVHMASGATLFGKLQSRE
ncbi:hypothetical protein L1N85_01955 [Paenibacillus alkaliterrae]|uniref:hypothetical protein n=1 Tax=Paenibacillus alkaliterrae TaxID=320909 RepID=UPI001F3E4EBE|nr:hypothetical protein [Paenibacillus alkaliterrae]MCF2937192.1 hypothetical protein [Paenibacillus alkaliterrae]